MSRPPVSPESDRPRRPRPVSRTGLAMTLLAMLAVVLCMVLCSTLPAAAATTAAVTVAAPDSASGDLTFGAVCMAGIVIVAGAVLWYAAHTRRHE
jgi:hypothetical protein